MRFAIESDQRIEVDFEPTGYIYTLESGQFIVVEWPVGEHDGMVKFEAGAIVVWAPSGGYNLAWDPDGVEIHIGFESGGNLC